MSFFVGKLCSCGLIVELCCLAEIKLKTIHRWLYLAGPRSLLVPLLCPNVFIWLNVPLFILSLFFSFGYNKRLCYVMLCYSYQLSVSCSFVGRLSTADALSCCKQFVDGDSYCQTGVVVAAEAERKLKKPVTNIFLDLQSTFPDRMTSAAPISLIDLQLWFSDHLAIILPN